MSIIVGLLCSPCPYLARVEPPSLSPGPGPSPWWLDMAKTLTFLRFDAQHCPPEPACYPCSRTEADVPRGGGWLACKHLRRDTSHRLTCTPCWNSNFHISAARSCLAPLAAVGTARPANRHRNERSGARLELNLSRHGSASSSTALASSSVSKQPWGATPCNSLVLKCDNGFNPVLAGSQ